MKKMIVKDLLKKSVKELIKLRNKLRKELFDLKLKNALRSLTQTHLIALTKKNIARVNAAIHEKLATESA